jgi:acid stress-induced BolA-like protein IbaG/YrbA
VLPHEVKDRIETQLQDSEAWVNEFSGGTDHYEVIVVSKQFEGLLSLKRHRLVMDLFHKEIETGEVHALSIKAFTPEQWKQKKQDFMPG